MAISFPLTMPASPSFKLSDFGNIDPTMVQPSPFTGVTKKLDRFGSVWIGDMTLPVMEQAEGRDWTGFLMSLRGQYGTFYCYDPDGTSPRGTISGTVTGTASARSRILTLSGSTGTLKRGDYLQVGTEYKMVVEDWSGSGDVSIEPPFRAAHSGSAVVYSNPVGIFRLASDERRWGGNELAHKSITLSIVEDF